MIDNHSTAPPPELFKQWEDDILNERDNVDHVLDCAWRDGFRAGADQELEACCQYIGSDGKWFANPEHRLAELRAARRPKPPTLARQALKITGYPKDFWSEDEVKTIRAALERLQELEGAND